MTEEHEHKKRIPAELIRPSTALKNKIGSGGLEKSVIDKAQASLEKNAVNVSSALEILLDSLESALHAVKSSPLHGEQVIETLLYPLVQLKAQGSMFHYSLVASISDDLIKFLENIPVLDHDVLDIVAAHKMAIKGIISGKLKGDGGKAGQDLRAALKESCTRYSNIHNKDKNR